MADADPVDALLIVSFGGPEGMDDVLPFLERVTAGRNIPAARLAQVAEQYRRFGGVSPINARTRALIDAVRRVLDEQGPLLPIYWGNRNWHPLLPDTVAQMAVDGVRHAAAFLTSAYEGHSSRDQYAENIAGARQQAGDGAPAITILPPFFDRPGFVTPFARGLRQALAADPARVVFTAHSVPVAMPGADRYEAGVRTAARLVAEAASVDDFDVVFQSRSGPPTQPWLEPDIGDHLAALAAAGTASVTVVPIGFVTDHMEVVFDLDVKAAEQAAGLGLRFTRVATPGTAPEFVAMIRDLLVELA